MEHITTQEAKERLDCLTLQFMDIDGKMNCRECVEKIVQTIVGNTTQTELEPDGYVASLRRKLYQYLSGRIDTTYHERLSLLGYTRRLLSE